MTGLCPSTVEYPPKNIEDPYTMLDEIIGDIIALPVTAPASAVRAMEQAIDGATSNPPRSRGHAHARPRVQYIERVRTQTVTVESTHYNPAYAEKIVRHIREHNAQTPTHLLIESLCEHTSNGIQIRALDTNEYLQHDIVLRYAEKGVRPHTFSVHRAPTIYRNTLGFAPSDINWLGALGYCAHVLKHIAPLPASGVTINDIEDNTLPSLIYISRMARHVFLPLFRLEALHEQGITTAKSIANHVNLPISVVQQRLDELACA